MRTPKKFVGLHSHDGNSVADGLGPFKDHADFVIENGMNALASTNHGHMNGFANASVYVKKLKEKGIKFKYIPGSELYIHPDLERWKREKQAAEDAKLLAKEEKKLAAKQREKVVTEIERKTDENDETIEMSNSMTIENEEETKSGKTFNPLNRRHHLVVLPKNSAALLKLFKLVSRGYVEGFYRFPRIDLRMLKEACQDGDMLVSSACLHPDTVIITSLGPKKIKEAVDLIKLGTVFSVLSFDENKNCAVYKTVTWGDQTRKNAKLIQIKLKSGKLLKLTPDHKVLTDCGWIEAQALTRKHHILTIHQDGGYEKKK